MEFSTSGQRTGYLVLFQTDKNIFFWSDQRDKAVGKFQSMIIKLLGLESRSKDNQRKLT